MGFFKKLLLLLCLLAIVSLIFAKKTPLEAKFLIDHLKSEEKTNDIVMNPDKYQNMPCFDLKFNGIEYCFDRSKAYVEKRYISTKGEDETVVLNFIPKALDGFNQNNKSTRVYWRVDKYHSNLINDPERFIHEYIRDSKVYDKLLTNVENGKFTEVTNSMKFDEYSSQRKNRYLIFVANHRVIMSAEIQPSNEYYNFMADVRYQKPHQATYFELSIISNQQTQEEFLQTVLSVAQEFEQYLESSKK